jgi:hypothetical protein
MPRDHTEAAQYIVRDLAEIASAKGEASPWLSDENYDALRHRVEMCSRCGTGGGVEARRRVRLKEGRQEESVLLMSWQRTERVWCS